MDQWIMYVMAGIIGGVVGFVARQMIPNKNFKEAEARAYEIIENSKKEAENTKKEAELHGKDTVIKLRQDFENEIRTKKEEYTAVEKRLIQKEESLEKRLDLLDRKEKSVNDKTEFLQKREQEIQSKSGELSQLIEDEKQKLQKISSMTMEEAKAMLLRRIDEELLHEKAVRIKQAEDEIKDTSEKKARLIISAAIQRCASEHTAGSTVTVVSLPSDEMKGRIIGREGRNIRALEAAAGVDIIIDDTPEAVTISGFDMYRREIAKIALEYLITDGRIHPGRIEEVVEKAKKDMENIIKEEGEKAAFDLGIHGMHVELLKLVGKLKFRTSYGQNGLYHTKEVALLCGAMADQLGLDVQLAKRAGLLHDIGKVVSQDIEEGTHAVVGGNLCRKYGEREEVANAVESHHDEVESKTIYSAIVVAGDAISASRPGARAETLETYVKRLENLEKIANSFKGINKAFALQAGREVRVMVDPEKMNDDECIVMARDLRKKIEEEMEYPGQIKVMILRETRAVEYAK